MTEHITKFRDFRGRYCLPVGACHANKTLNITQKYDHYEMGKFCNFFEFHLLDCKCWTYNNNPCDVANVFFFKYFCKKNKKNFFYESKN